MSDRIDEFKDMLNKAGDIEQSVSMDNLRKNVKKKARRHHLAVACRNTGIACAAFLAVIGIGVNTSKTFASVMDNIPIVRNIAEAFTFNKGYEEAINSNYLTSIHQVCKNDVCNMELAYAMGDDKKLILLLKQVDKEVPGSVEVMNYNGKEVDFSYTLGLFSEDNQKEYEGYTVLDLDWNGFSKENSIELLLRCNDGRIATYSYEFTLKEKLETKKYEVNQSVEVGEHSLIVDSIEVHPLSTVVKVNTNDLDPSEVVSIQFTVSDGKGQKTNVTSGFTSYYYDDSVTYTLESGYFTMEDITEISVDKVEIRTKETKDVYYDKNQKKFFEADGTEAKDIHIIEDEIDDVVAVTIDGRDTGNMIYTNVFTRENESSKEGYRGDTVYLFVGEEKDENGIIHYFRVYPNETYNDVATIKLK